MRLVGYLNKNQGEDFTQANQNHSTFVVETYGHTFTSSFLGEIYLKWVNCFVKLLTSILNLTMTLVTRRELVTVLDITKRSLGCWDLGIGRHSAMRQSIADRVNVCNPTPYVTWNISPIQPESLITCSIRVKKAHDTQDFCSQQLGITILRAVASFSLQTPEFNPKLSPCGICDGQNVTGAGFCRGTSVFPWYYHSTKAPPGVV